MHVTLGGSKGVVATAQTRARSTVPMMPDNHQLSALHLLHPLISQSGHPLCGYLVAAVGGQAALEGEASSMA